MRQSAGWKAGSTFASAFASLVPTADSQLSQLPLAARRVEQKERTAVVFLLRCCSVVVSLGAAFSGIAKENIAVFSGFLVNYLLK